MLRPVSSSSVRVDGEPTRTVPSGSRALGVASIFSNAKVILPVCLLLYSVVVVSASSKVAPEPPPTDPNVIRLADGATTQIVSLDDYLATQPSPEEPNRSQPDALDPSASTQSKPARLVVLRPQPPLNQSLNEQLQEPAAQPATAAPAEAPRHVESSVAEDLHRQPQPQQQQHERHGHQHAEPAAAANGTKPIPQHWQVKSLLNVTHDYPLAYSQIICGYVWPLMAAITCFTNLMIVFVLTQRDMRTPTNVVLTAIAVADIIPIVVPVPWFVYLFAMGNEKQVLYPPVACYFYQHLTRSVSELFYFLSTWLNVLLAVQDYLTACWPQAARRYCRIRVVVVEIVALSLLAFLLNLPQALKLVFKPVKFYYNGQLTWGCKAMQARWFKDLVGEYVALYDDIFTAIIVLFVDGGPAVLLITLTALLIRQLQRQRIKGHLLMEQARTASKRRRERHRQQEYESSARVMIFVLLAFLAVKIPFATTYTLMIIQSRFNIRFVDNLVDFQKAISLTDLVFVLSYPINFTIFCCCSKKFRHKCAQLLSECNESSRDTRGRLWSSFSDSLAGAANGSIDGHWRRDSGKSRNDSLDTNTNNSCSHYAPQKRESYVSMLNRRQRPDDDTDELIVALSDTNCVGVDSIEQQQQRRSSRTHTIAEEGPAAADGWSCVNADNHHHHGHQQQPERRHQEGEKPADLRLKSLVEAGSLCVECIMRYEQMKKSLTRSMGGSMSHRGEHHANNYAAAAEGIELKTASQSSDSSSTGWANVCQLPAPPQPVSILQQQNMPTIITTRCESIRERDSSEETSGSSGQGAGGAEEPPASQPVDQAPVQTQHRKLSAGSDENLSKEPRDSPRQEANLSRRAQVSQEEREKWDAKVAEGSLNQSANSVDGAGRAEEILAQDQRERYHHHHHHRLGDHDETAHLRRPKRNGRVSTSNKRIPSDPGPSVSASTLAPSSLRPEKGSSDEEEDSDRSQDRRRGSHARSAGKPKKSGNNLTLKGDAQRQRSLSLSNSKLSTLPVATGMLADMFVTALIGASQQGSRKSLRTSDDDDDHSTGHERR